MPPFKPSSFKPPRSLSYRTTSKSRNKYSIDNYKLLVQAYFEEKYTKKNLINVTNVTKLHDEMIKFYAHFNTNKQRKRLNEIYRDIEKSYLPTPPKGDTPPLNHTPPINSSTSGTPRPPLLRRASILRGAGKKSRRKNTKKRKLTKKKNRKGQKS